DNAGALPALDEYVRREPDEKQAAEAWALGEVLRCGAGVPEPESDYVEYAFVYQVRDGAKLQKLLEYLDKNGRMLGGRVDQNRRRFTATLVEAPKPRAAGAGAPQPLHFAGHLAVVQHLVRISSPSRQLLLTVAAELEEKAAGALQNRREDAGPLPFRYIL